MNFGVIIGAVNWGSFLLGVFAMLAIQAVACLVLLSLFGSFDNDDE